MIPYTPKETYTIDDLCELVTLLRRPDGCPWDKVQTHTSLRSDLIEETYEVIEAIDRDDPKMMREELGDLLLQVVFHARLEEEQGRSTFSDIVTDVCAKLVERHPHVFSTTNAETTEEALASWESVKTKSKGQTTVTETLEEVAKPLPALMRAQKVRKRAAKSDMPALEKDALLAQMQDSLSALQAAAQADDKDAATKALGSLFFCGAGVASAMGLEAEQSLTDTTNAFISQFAAFEDNAAEKPLNTVTRADWQAQEETEHAAG